jgi:hypothetical protein
VSACNLPPDVSAASLEPPLKPDNLERLLLSYLLFRFDIEVDIARRGAEAVAAEQEAAALAFDQQAGDLDSADTDAEPEGNAPEHAGGAVVLDVDLIGTTGGTGWSQFHFSLFVPSGKERLPAVTFTFLDGD